MSKRKNMFNETSIPELITLMDILELMTLEHYETMSIVQRAGFIFDANVLLEEFQDKNTATAMLKERYNEEMFQGMITCLNTEINKQKLLIYMSITLGGHISDPIKMLEDEKSVISSVITNIVDEKLSHFDESISNNWYQ